MAEIFPQGILLLSRSLSRKAAVVEVGEVDYQMGYKIEQQPTFQLSFIQSHYDQE